MDYYTVLGILVLLLGILLTIERLRRADNNDGWFTPGFYNSMIGAILLIVLGLGLILKYFEDESFSVSSFCASVKGVFSIYRRGFLQGDV